MYDLKVGDIITVENSLGKVRYNGIVFPYISEDGEYKVIDIKLVNGDTEIEVEPIKEN